MINLAERRRRLAELAAKVTDAPAEWFSSTTVAANGRERHAGSVEAETCSTFAECERAWDRNYGGALYWRQDLCDGLAVILAVCASTKQAGNQLFFDLIGSPGSAKTTLCRGLLVSGHCIHVENISKLVSGFRKAGDGGKDCSFIARANDKTWVTCEFDTLGSSPEYHQLMGKVRRIFDGETSTTYGNSDEDRIYTALRTPWIRAGTHKMIDHDQSHLGDRFMRFVISDPGHMERRDIALAALESEYAAMLESSNCTAGSIVDARTRRAHALTGGYVDWLRTHAEEELSKVDADLRAKEKCIDLAELTADLRARPHESKDRHKPTEAHDSKELPTRLARQNYRLAKCLAVVLRKRTVDADVLRIVRKVALDTACGHSLNLVQWLCAADQRNGGRSFQDGGGFDGRVLAGWLGMTSDRAEKYLMFLRKIDVLAYRHVRQTSGTWMLTERAHALYLRIMGD